MVVTEMVIEIRVHSVCWVDRGYASKEMLYV